MLQYLFKRILSAVPVMLVVSAVIFLLLNLAPGDPTSTILGQNATPEDIARLRQSMGLDQPLYAQFASWLVQVAQGDLGVSLISQTPVTQLMMQRASATVNLALATVLVSVAIAVPLGVIAAYNKGKLLDKAIMSIALVGISAPVFIIGYSLALLFSVRLGWFPIQGYVEPGKDVVGFLRSISLPTMTLALGYVALIARITRVSMIEVMSEDFIRTARAKGISDARIYFVHALRNAAPPIVTTIGIGIALLIGGAVVTETVFNLPGLGRLLVDSIASRDYPVIQGIVIVFSLSYIVINLLVDICYVAIDPRLRGA
ncbi:ABC transporter permease [Devosia sp. A369]